MKIQILKNGVRLITIPVPATKTFTILVMVEAGSRYEIKENNGISHFLEHMFFKGTRRRPNTLAISSELDKVGGEYNAFTSKEYTGYYAKVDGRHSGLAIDVISDILLNSIFSKKEIERERGVIAEEINMYNNNPMIHIGDLFEECLYGDTPAGWDTIGTRENILRFQREDFIDYFKKYYRGNNLVIGLAGSFTSVDVSLAKDVFSSLASGENSERYRWNGEQSAPRLKIKKQATKQINFSLGVPAYSYHHPDYYTVQLLGVILGGSMSSRLFIAVRERQGLAYQVHTQVESYSDSGYLATTVGTSKELVSKAIGTILEEYKKLTRKEVAAGELKKAKDYIRGKLILNLESSDSMALWFTRQRVLGQKILTPEEYLRKIQRITPSGIKRVASEMFKPEKINLAIIGEGVKERRIKNILNF